MRGSRVRAEGVGAMSEPIDLGDGARLDPLTRTDAFFALTPYKGPPIDIDHWVLKIGGAVQKPVERTYEALTGSYRRVSAVVTMECVINPVGGRYVGTAVWSGVPLRDVFQEVEVDEGAVDLFCTSADGLNRGFPLTYFRTPGTLLAYEMNGQPLPLAYGFPLRLVVPGYYGFVWRKWLQALTLSEERYADPEWLASMEAVKSERVVLTSKILKPQPQEVMTRTPYAIAGVAWGGATPIQRVDVSVDGGRTWQPADIVWRPPHPGAWVVWRRLWVPPAAGSYVVTARAIDAEDRAQLDGEDAYPSGFGRRHRVNVRVR
jgi:DMSO/TMAO reductase YedYZ molybdopterin-dependent catalytic subunit